MTIVLVVIVVLIVAVRACAGSGTSGDSSGTSSESSDAESATKQPASSGKASSDTKQKQESTVGLGQSVTVGDGEWVINSAQPTTQLADQFGIQAPKQGNFVIVDFTFTNNGNEAKTLTQTIMALLDSSNRKSSPDTDTFGVIPNEKNIFIDQVNPGVSKDGEVIFSVAPDSSGFQLELSDTSFLKSNKGYVDLGF